MYFIKATRQELSVVRAHLMDIIELTDDSMRKEDDQAIIAEWEEDRIALTSFLSKILIYN